MEDQADLKFDELMVAIMARASVPLYVQDLHIGREILSADLFANFAEASPKMDEEIPIPACVDGVSIDDAAEKLATRGQVVHARNLSRIEYGDYEKIKAGETTGPPPTHPAHTPPSDSDIITLRLRMKHLAIVQPGPFSSSGKSVPAKHRLSR